MKEPVDSTKDVAFRAVKEANVWVVAVILAVVVVPIFFAFLYLFAPLLFSPPGIGIMILVAVAAFIGYKRKMRMTRQLSEKFEAEGAARTVELLWRPLEIEFRQVIESEGAMTSAKSLWTGTESFLKLESGNRFQAGMDEYVNQRTTVATMSSNSTDSDPDQSSLETERQRLVDLSEDLLVQTRSAIRREAEQAFQ